VVSHHLDGFLLLDPAAVLQAAADPGVHRVSFRRETEFPAMLLPPSEAFPPPTATGPRNEFRTPVGSRHRFDRFRPSRSPRTLPSHPFPSPARASTVSRRLGHGGGRGLKALLHRRVRCALGRFQPTAPGAPLGLTNLRVPASLPRRRPRER
jgi:hypothetical protein